MQAWEPLATELACSSSDDEVARLIARLLQQDQTAASSCQDLPVLLGCDTRLSSPALMQAASEGIQAMGLRAVQLGQVTTPQLHFQASRHPGHRLSVPCCMHYVLMEVPTLGLTQA